MWPQGPSVRGVLAVMDGQTETRCHRPADKPGFWMKAFRFCRLLSLRRETKPDVESVMKVGGFCRGFDPLC